MDGEVPLSPTLSREGRGGTAGGEVDVAAGGDGGALGGAAGLGAFALAAGAADADAEVDAAGLLSGGGVSGTGHLAFVIGDGHLVGLAVDGGALPCLDRVHCIFTRKRDVGRRQCFHARVAGVVGGFAHLLGGLHGGDDGAGEGEGQAALFESGFGLVVAGFSGFVDVDFLGGEVDVALGGEEVAAGLGVGFAGLEVDVASGAADGAGGRRGDRAFLVGALLLGAEGDADAAAAEEAGFFLILEVGFEGGVGGGCDGEVVLGGECRAVVADDVAAFDINVPVGEYGCRLAGEGGRLRRGLIQCVACGDGFFAEEAFAFVLMRFVDLDVGFACGEVDVVPGGGEQVASVAGDIGGFGVEVVA